MNTVHHVEEVEVGIGSTTEGSFLVALEGHGIGIMTIPMHISRGVAQIIKAVIPRVVIGVAPARKVLTVVAEPKEKQLI